MPENITIDKIILQKNLFLNVNLTYFCQVCNNLAEDIKKNGLKEPLKVVKRHDTYLIADGNHRFFALLILGWKEIPCEIIEDALKREVVLITGGTQGIGKGIAMAFAKQGAIIILNYHSNDEEARKAQEEIYFATKNHVEIFKADVVNEEQVERMINTIKEWFGQIDVLVNNAGIFRDAVSWKMEKEVWDSVLATNLTGAFLCTKHVLPLMREKGFGRIINVSSVVGEIGVFGASNYAASKAGLIGFTKAVSKEVAIKGITVNCIALGYINAGMNLRLPEETREKIREIIPMKRFGTVEEVADTVIFLASENASYITGQVININGGLF